jgi:hypothetical protein
MRATNPPRAPRRRGLITGLVTASVLALTVFAGSTALAANSRVLYVGSGLVDSAGNIVDAVDNATGQPPSDGIPDNAGTNSDHGILVPTTVSAGYTTVIPIQVMNGDNQTIAHVFLTFPTAGFTLDPGLTITGHSGPNGASCTDVKNAQNTAIVSVSCNFANLAAGALRTVYVFVSTTAASASAATPIFSVQVTTNNENGSNLQLFKADSGGFKVSPQGTDGLDAFAPFGLPVPTLATKGPAGNNKLQTRVDFSQTSGGNLVTIAETDNGGTQFKYVCPVGLSCQPFDATINVQDGLTGTGALFNTSPFLQVTLTALVPKTYNLSKAFVAHYDATSVNDWTLFWATKSTKCGTDVAAAMTKMDQCFLSATLSKPNANGFETVVLTVVMKHNGGTRM